MKKTVCIKIAALLAFTAAFAAPNDSAWFMAQTEQAELQSVLATSELVEAQFKGEYLYPPINIFDGDFATVWCEAEKNGPGIGESITVEFSQPVSFDEIQIVNGFVYKDYYAKNNRVKSILLTQTANRHFQQKEYTLKDNVQNWQSISFALPQTAQTLTIKLTDVYKGNKYDDTCLADIRLLYKGKVVPFKNVAALKKVQEENSKLLLTHTAEDFQKDFFALFTKVDDGEARLTLRNDKGGAVKIGKWDDRIVYLYSYVLLSAQSKKSIAHYFAERYGVPEDSVLEWLDGYDANKYDYVSVNPYRFPDDYDSSYELKNYRIITHRQIEYVDTATVTLVKLDGKYVYLNGVKYTVVDPKRVFEFEIEILE